MAITLQETLRGLFYAPFYLALARGAYEQEGVEVRFVSAPAPGDAARGLFDGSVDVCWGGPMRVMQAYQADAENAGASVVLRAPGKTEELEVVDVEYVAITIEPFREPLGAQAKPKGEGA